MNDDRFWVGPLLAPETYQLVTCLGSGGEGEVWTAVLPLSTDGQRDVAVKILPDNQEDDEAAWVQHGHLLRSVSHPGVVRVLEVFTGPVRHRRGEPSAASARYVVMDLVPGITLREWLDEHPEATTSQRLKALATVAAALDEMHSGNQTKVPMAHGDVKPSNIVIRDDMSTVLVDLGLTRLADGDGRIGRSRPYAAPELFYRGARTTPEADRFAFAATVAHALLGEPPPTVAGGGPDIPALKARLSASTGGRRRPILVRALVEALSCPPERRPTSLRQWLSSLTDSLSQMTESLAGESAPDGRSDVASEATAVPSPEQPSHGSTTTHEVDQHPERNRARGRRRIGVGIVYAVAIALTVAVTITVGITVNLALGRSPGDDSGAQPQAGPSVAGAAASAGAVGEEPAKLPPDAGSVQPPPQSPIPIQSGREASPPQQVCATSWRIDPWAAEVCSTISSDGSQVSGYMSIRCYEGDFEYVACQTIVVREIELFANDMKLAKWVGGTYGQGDLVTGNVTHPCAADTRYYIKGWEVAVQGPDGTWSDTKNIGPEFTYYC